MSGDFQYSRGKVHLKLDAPNNHTLKTRDIHTSRNLEFRTNDGISCSSRNGTAKLQIIAWFNADTRRVFRFDSRRKPKINGRTVISREILEPQKPFSTRFLHNFNHSRTSMNNRIKRTCLQNRFCVARLRHNRHWHTRARTEDQTQSDQKLVHTLTTQISKLEFKINPRLREGRERS